MAHAMSVPSGPLRENLCNFCRVHQLDPHLARHFSLSATPTCPSKSVWQMKTSLSSSLSQWMFYRTANPQASFLIHFLGHFLPHSIRGTLLKCTSTSSLSVTWLSQQVSGFEEQSVGGEHGLELSLNVTSTCQLCKQPPEVALEDFPWVSCWSSHPRSTTEIPRLQSFPHRPHNA